VSVFARTVVVRTLTPSNAEVMAISAPLLKKKFFFIRIPPLPKNI